MKLYCAIALSLAFIQPAFAAQKSGSIHCEEFNLGGNDDGSDQHIANIDVKLDRHGEVVSVQVDRVKADDNEAFKLTFDHLNSQILHNIVSGKVIDTDEDTKKPIYDWGIEKIEMIDAQNEKDGIHMMLNDHTYSGTPGSSFVYTVNGKKVASSPNFMNCSGQLQLPLGNQ
jgi:hypothetical protein